MTLRCYDIHDQTTFAAVIFARSHADAIGIGNLHLESYRGYQSTMMTAIERKPGRSGRVAEHLTAAIDAEVSGVGHLQRDDSWLVLAPADRPEHVVRPRPTEMHHYIDDDDYQVVLFARDHSRADALYDAIQADYRVLPSGWLGSEWDAWSTVGLVRHKRQAGERGVEGLGIYTQDGWLILPLDYDALGVDPPD